MLNTILYNDIYENYYTYQYRSSYLKSEYYNHVAWVISNKNVFNAINSIGFNMLNNKLKYDFKLEIFKILDKKINANEIVVYHPSFEEAHYTKKDKVRTYHKKDSSNVEWQLIYNNVLQGLVQESGK